MSPFIHITGEFRALTKKNSSRVRRNSSPVQKCFAFKLRAPVNERLLPDQANDINAQMGGAEKKCRDNSSAKFAQKFSVTTRQGKGPSVKKVCSLPSPDEEPDDNRDGEFGNIAM